MDSIKSPFEKGERRGTLEVYLDMLCVVGAHGEEGAKKTNIVYGARVGWKNIKKHLDYLISRGLLEKHEDNTYHLRIEGIEVIKKHYLPIVEIFYPQVIIPEAL